MHILHVVGARPNFMKLAPVYAALQDRAGVRQTVVHTGQHYDAAMSEVFFRELGLPAPDINLEVGSHSHAQQTAAIMMRFEPVLLTAKPDVVLVYGDVNSTVAAALVASKLLVPIAHVEAGLRSFDRTMPEEINRLLTDSLADLLLTPSVDAHENLAREGIPSSKIRFVGNVMIDTLVRLLPRAVVPEEVNGLSHYALVTLHRPSNVDEPEMLARVLKALEEIAKEMPVIFPIHPRTRQRIEGFGLTAGNGNGIRLLNPLPYLGFLGLQRQAAVVITDSGGIQEETTFLGVPCITLRTTTERPVTVTEGTNTLIGDAPERLHPEVMAILGGRRKAGRIPPLWDGQAAKRIADILVL
ncbi:UDP-2,3-diacetamido-2,3-dideoxy-D-glucuronate 2-epimerase [Candidatus Methylomirabilis lanthanidiphila]|uniref:UDP-2,3-diacetamido-2,3-dideoxy-D-glucuronate 2-epimerase n=1 Tax=Candidatus Methylomirabilis lanthanidiphila TaxID=2211376 RepID=A0A564ZHJ8_9BACT|nr:UDP-2,3-diacetamido-2,3-dideoxy-D-glucuronate 2-epimerase [Candidatus Methylomirabilis lanthanidiphila]